ncbi:MAG: GNAT family N-acetyltransferase [Ferruginibacter sp.]
MKLNWKFKKFEKLKPQELYDILNLRNKVFVVEQNCVYLDTDNKDQGSYHLCGWDDEILVAYARIIPPGIAFPEASIGRVVTDPSYRKNGLGKELMDVAIEKTLGQFTVSTIKIGAQTYLLNFYTSLGFTQSGPGYLEDGIPHVEMVLIK